MNNDDDSFIHYSYGNNKKKSLFVWRMFLKMRINDDDEKVVKYLRKWSIRKKIAVVHCNHTNIAIIVSLHTHTHPYTTQNNNKTGSQNSWTWHRNSFFWPIEMKQNKTEKNNNHFWTIFEKKNDIQNANSLWYEDSGEWRIIIYFLQNNIPKSCQKTKQKNSDSHSSGS